MAEVRKRTRIQVWQDVIFAIFIREIRSKFNDKIGISWAVLQPVSFILILSFIRGRMDGGLTHSMPTFVFMMYGMIFIQLFLSTLNSTSSAIQRNKALFAFRQVQPISAVIANALFEGLVKVFVRFMSRRTKYERQKEDIAGGGMEGAASTSTQKWTLHTICCN